MNTDTDTRDTIIFKEWEHGHGGVHGNIYVLYICRTTVEDIHTEYRYI